MFIHMICIWNLVWSGMLLLHLLGPLVPAPALLASLPLVGGLAITAASFTTLTYVVSYLLMDPVAGGVGALLMLLLHQWTYGLALASAPVLGLPLWQAALAFHVFCWVLQVRTHLPLLPSPCTSVHRSRCFRGQSTGTARVLGPGHSWIYSSS